MKMISISKYHSHEPDCEAEVAILPVARPATTLKKD